FQGSTTRNARELMSQIQAWKAGSAGRAVRTGVNTSDYHTTLAREPSFEFYCTDLVDLCRFLGDDVKESRRFSNLRILETNDPTVFFDAGEDLLSAPLQTYLELASSGDKREQDAAVELGRHIMQSVTLKMRAP